MEKVIGIVGGVGPLAGLDLQAKILEQTIASKDQDHLTIVSLSKPYEITDRTEYLIGETAVNPAYALAEQINTLNQMGATVIAIPCNSAHAPEIFDSIQSILQEQNSHLQLLHMIKETADFLRRHYHHCQRIGILSTTGTNRSRLYPRLLGPAGFEVIVPQATLQDRIHQAIYHPRYGIKSCGIVTDDARANLAQGVAFLQAEGAEAIILGCTEIPLAIQTTYIGPTAVIDPTFVLARALIRNVAPTKLKPWQPI